VVTGALTASRADVQKRIEAAGGKVAGSVSKKTSYLVAGEDTGKAKLEAAQKHGVVVITEQELEVLLSGGSLGGAAETVAAETVAAETVAAETVATAETAAAGTADL